VDDDDDDGGGDDDGDDSKLENGIMIGLGCALGLIIVILVSYCKYRRKRPLRSILENDSQKDEGVVGHVAEHERETTKEEGNFMGINKGGLVSNNHNHGETEVIDLTDNIYYESVDLHAIRK